MTFYELRWAAGGHIPETVRFFRPEQSPDHLVRFAEVVVLMDRDPEISAAWAHLKQIDGRDVNWIAGWTKCSDERPTAAGFETVEALLAHPPGRAIVQPGEETAIDRVWRDAANWRALNQSVDDLERYVRDQVR